MSTGAAAMDVKEKPLRWTRKAPTAPGKCAVTDEPGGEWFVVEFTERDMDSEGGCWKFFCPIPEPLPPEGTISETTIKAIVSEMADIITSEDSSEDERSMALDTIREAVCPQEAAEWDVEECSQEYHEIKRQEERFAERVKELMREKGLRQEDLAQLTGVSQPAISHILNRRCRPQQRTVQKIAAALGVTADAIWEPLPPEEETMKCRTCGSRPWRSEPPDVPGKWEMRKFKEFTVTKEDFIEGIYFPPGAEWRLIEALPEPEEHELVKRLKRLRDSVNEWSYSEPTKPRDELDLIVSEVAALLAKRGEP